MNCINNKLCHTVIITDYYLLSFAPIKNNYLNQVRNNKVVLKIGIRFSRHIVLLQNIGKNYNIKRISWLVSVLTLF